MNTKLLSPIAALCLALFAPACGPKPTSSTSGTPPAAPGKSTETTHAFIARVKQQLDAKSLDGLMALVNWQGVEKDTREMLSGEFKGAIATPPTRVEWAERDKDMPAEYEMKGVKYRPNLPIVGTLKFVVEDKQNKATASTGFSVGIKDGRYFITTAVPVGK